MIFLLDIHVVLVENRAYRVGIQHTTGEFSRRVTVPVTPSTDADIDVFESESTNVAWDECAMFTATLVIERLRRDAADGAAALLAVLHSVQHVAKRLAGAPGLAAFREGSLGLSALAKY